MMGGGPEKDIILVLLPFPEAGAEPLVSKLRKHHPQLEIRYKQSPYRPGGRKAADDVAPDAAIYKDITILFTLGVLPNTLSAAPHLDYIQLLSAGSNAVESSPFYTDTDVTIATASGIHGPQIAECVIMTTLVHSHKYKALYELQKRHEWGTKVPSSNLRSVRDQVGRRLGVLGYGSIGRQVGRVARALGMDVIAFTASPKKTPDSKRDKGFIVPGTGDEDGSIPSAWYSGLDRESLHKFLKQDIDVLLISVPLTKQTKGMLGAEEFRILSGKDTKPFLVNIARGPIVKTDDLIAALKDGTLGGAALDVTDPEPLPSDSELWDLENAIITPHVSGLSQAYNDRVFELFDEQLTRRAKGEKLFNVVQRERGY